MKAAYLRIETVNPRPPGGQHVMPTTSKVMVTHLPTGLTATCGCDRSQKRNRDAALAMIERGLTVLGWTE